MKPLTYLFLPFGIIYVALGGWLICLGFLNDESRIISLGLFIFVLGVISIVKIVNWGTDDAKS